MDFREMADSDLEQCLRERGVDFGDLHVEYSGEFGWRAAFKSYRDSSCSM